MRLFSVSEIFGFFHFIFFFSCASGCNNYLSSFASIWTLSAILFIKFLSWCANKFFLSDRFSISVNNSEI
jgi:hypothetical protein